MLKHKEYELKWPHLGNEQATRFLSQSLSQGKIASVYLFVGPDDVGKTTLASAFAASLLCVNYGKGGLLPCGSCPSCVQNQVAKSLESSQDLSSVHPDMHLLRREAGDKNIKIEAVRDFIHDMNMSSFHNSYKVGIIKQADSLSTNGANALLKTLEEPKEGVVVILVAREIELVPKTIISRAQVVRFYPVKTEVIYHYLLQEHNVKRSEALHLSRLALGRPALAVKLLKDADFYAEYKKRIMSFLQFARQPINERWKVVGDLLGEKATGQEATRKAERILETWQGVMRDLLLLQYGHKDLVQHELAIETLDEVAKLVTPDKIVTWQVRLAESRQFLAANVGARNTLEHLVSII